MKKYLKYIGGFIGVLIIGGAIFWGVKEYRYRQSPEYQVMKYYNDLADQYAKDTYGGDTPEQTLQLFIDALKKGDVELASKYFVIEKQEKERNYLEEVNGKNLLNEMISDLEKTIVEKKNDTAFFTLLSGKKVVSQGVMYLINNKWKISEL